MKYANKGNKSPSEEQFDFVKNKVDNVKNSGSTSLRSTLLKFKKAKQISFLREQTYFSKNEEENQITNQNTIYNKDNNIKKSIFLTKNISQIRNDSLKSTSQSKDRKQTFKDFIKKIQLFNQNRLSNINSIKTLNYEEQNQQNHINKSPYNKNCIQNEQKANNFVYNYPFMMIQGKKQPQTTPYKNFIIHHPHNQRNFTRNNRRSKTQQQIKFQLSEDKNNIILQDNKAQSKQKSKQAQIVRHDTEENQYLSSCYPQQNAFQKKKKLVNHISLKLMQKDRTLQILGNLKQANKNVTSLNSSLLSKDKPNDKFLGKHRKFLKTRFSKIRIRVGSSTHNKSTSLIENNEMLCSKDNLFENFETINSENLQSLQNKRNSKNNKRNTLNSSYCEAKILEAQQAFIQKRRLLPTAGENREQMLKIKKQYFTISNSTKRKSKFNSEFLGDDNEAEPHEKLLFKKSRVDKLNGWEVRNDEEIVNHKIQEFY